MGLKESGTLLDIILHNKNLITDTQVIGCPYSDHKFIVGSIEIEKVIYFKEKQLVDTN